MPWSIARKAVDLALAQPGPTLSIGFFGGEPLLQFPLIRDVVAYARQAAQENERDACFTVVTNGTRLTEEVAAYLEENQFLVQLSLDGPRLMHDRARLYAGGRSSFDDVVDALRILQSYSVTLKVVCVLTPGNVDIARDAFRYLTEELGVTDLYLNIDYLSAWSTAEQATLERLLESYADDLIASYREELEVAVNLFDEKIRTHIHQGYGDRNLCPFGDGRVAVDVTGDLYPCDRVARDGMNAELIIGHVDTGIDHPRVRHFLGCLRTPNATCVACEYRPRCRSWCGCAIYESAGNLESISPFFCAMEKCQIRCADRIAETLFQEGNTVFLKKFYGRLVGKATRG